MCMCAFKTRLLAFVLCVLSTETLLLCRLRGTCRILTFASATPHIPRPFRHTSSVHGSGVADMADTNSCGSVHLKLKDIASVVDEAQETGSLPNEEAVNDSSDEDGVFVHQFKLKQENSTVLACVGGRTALEHFCACTFGRNYSEDADHYYAVEKLDDTNRSAKEAELSALWLQRKYLSRSKSYKDDWVDPAQRRPLTLQRLLQANAGRIQDIMHNVASVEAMRTFLSTAGSLGSRSWQEYVFDSQRSGSEQIALLQEFAQWFRQQFPYYYDQCLLPSCMNRDGNEYLGTVYPAEEELGPAQCGASRTELYLCGSCKGVSRFPRYNVMTKVLDTRRGRCGEYSVLVLHMLQALGYTARWVVDRDDHVWAEVLLEGAWVHLDPCEAAVDQALLYESWGKKPTFVLAYMPDGIEDVTHRYCADAREVIAHIAIGGCNGFVEASRTLAHCNASLSTSFVMSVLGFELEWLDEVSGLLQTLYLKFFLDDNTIELLKGTSTFLKRIYYPEVKLSDLFVGNTITVFNRLMVIKCFANKATTEFMKTREVRYLCKVGRNSLSQLGALLIAAKKCGLVVGKVVTTSSSFYSNILRTEIGDVVMEFVGIVTTDKNAFMSALNAPGLSSVNAAAASAQEIEDAFQSCGKSAFRSQNCTLCVVKPHIMKAETAGELLNTITQDGRFKISAVFSIHLTLAMGEELLEVYRGLYLNYTGMLEHMCSTPVLAVMISGTGAAAEYEDIVSTFREFVGPSDPALAKMVRPESLRARFGESVVKNAVHCTDLPEDGEMECRYFFETLASL